MAIDNCSAISSPRISFSYNLSQFDKVVHSGKRASPLAPSNSNDDFEFPSWDSNAVMKCLYADELFTGGRIITAGEVKEQNKADKTRAKRRGTLQVVPALDPATWRVPESVVMKSTNKMEREKGSGSKDCSRVTNKVCRRIKQSNSLNDSNSCKPRLCFLPLVSRSCSTGSAPLRSRTGPERLNWRSRVSPVTSVASRDVFGLSTLFMSRRTSLIRV